jgi:glycosyltransferase involved in cell wall biosynthesis
MRILMLGPHPGIRGPLPKLTPHLVAALRALGCEVTMEPWGRRREHEPVRDKIVQRLADIRRVRRTLRRQSFDLLIVETAHDWATLSRDIPLLLGTRALCRRAVLHFHGSACDRLVAPGRRAFKLASALLLRLSDAALVLSSEEQRQWQTFYPRGRFYQVCNPFLAPAAVDPAPRRCQLGLPTADPVVLFVGRLMESKGIRDLVAILPQVLARVPFHLLVVGDGPLEQHVRQCAAQVSVGKRLTLAGYLEGGALQGAYHLADIFVLPTWAEGFPLAVLEAMAAGLPVVTTRIRGMADHLRERVNALFVPPRDPAALAAALIRLLGDPVLRARMGQANREKVREFTPEIVGRHFLDVLRQVVEGRTPEAKPRTSE